MQLIQSRKIIMDNLWEPELYGIFARRNDTVVFYFSNYHRLYALEDQGIPRILHCARGHSFPLPYHWRWIETPASSFLLLSESMGLNLADESWLSPIPLELSMEYIKRIFPEKHLEEDEYIFDDYCISHKGMCGYTCTRQGEHLWDFQGRAYLYTEPERYQDKIYFGTAGFGGYFYILDLETGKPLAQIKTGGTSCVVRLGDMCYLLRNDGKTSMVCIDLQNGEIIDSTILPGKASDHSRIQLIDNKLHAITFQKRNGRLHYALWNTVQL